MLPTACPERFMYVCGLTNNTRSPARSTSLPRAGGGRRAADRPPPAFRQPIDHHEADIVTIPRALPTGVPQAHHDLHHATCRSPVAATPTVPLIARPLFAGFCCRGGCTLGRGRTFRRHRLGSRLRHRLRL